MFDPSTKGKILTILSIQISQKNSDQLGTILNEIDSIDNGSMVAPIEALVSQIESIQQIASSPASLKLSGMIKADVVEWQPNGGAGVGVKQQLKELKNQLRDLLGLSRSSDSSVTMSRSDAYSLAGRGSQYSDWRFLAW
jgi:hypothetical protein